MFCDDPRVENSSVVAPAAFAEAPPGPGDPPTAGEVLAAARRNHERVWRLAAVTGDCCDQNRQQAWARRRVPAGRGVGRVDVSA